MINNFTRFQPEVFILLYSISRFRRTLENALRTAIGSGSSGASGQQGQDQAAFLQRQMQQRASSPVPRQQTSSPTPNPLSASRRSVQDTLNNLFLRRQQHQPHGSSPTPSRVSSSSRSASQAGSQSSLTVPPQGPALPAPVAPPVPSVQAPTAAPGFQSVPPPPVVAQAEAADPYPQRWLQQHAGNGELG